MSQTLDWSAFGLRPGTYNVIEADPPWSYRCFSEKGEARSAKAHYPVMGLDDICRLPVGELAARNCHLFLWTTGPNLMRAHAVMDAWGFRFSTVAFTWIKLRRGLRDRPALFLDAAADFHVGMGHTTRKNAEYCLLGRKGSPRRLSKSIRELIVAPVREHSRKPDEAYARICAYAAGPRAALFTRERRDGFDCWGNEVGKFDAVPVAAE